MRRILMRLAVAAVMAAMVLALAVPAFADTGGMGHNFPTTGNLTDCNPPTGSCDVTAGHAGPSVFGNGLTTLNAHVVDGQGTLTLNHRGEAPGGGSGGNCTTTFSTQPPPITTSGNGSAC